MWRDAAGCVGVWRVFTCISERNSRDSESKFTRAESSSTRDACSHVDFSRGPSAHCEIVTCWCGVRGGAVLVRCEGRGGAVWKCPEMSFDGDASYGDASYIECLTREWNSLLAA